ncbi:ABC transporter substrate-binding protein [Chitinimonas koreensis]|nr:ABC transporter substrate-binding protein [Chitinimonas koreensis]
MHPAGSDRPEKEEVQVGFIPLTDCASVVMAAVLGFDRKYGIRIVPRREASWAAIRDKLAGGELDAAHALYGLVYGVQMGIGGPQCDMNVLMTLNQNGQAITLSSRLAADGATDGERLARKARAAPRTLTFAQTFPTGTHAMWLYYWLAAHGIDPLRDVNTIVVPPPQMVAHMRVGNMDGFCAGEPWHQRAIAERAGFTAATSQAIWPGHPEKVLGTTAAFARRHPNTARALVMALLDASRWIDAQANRRRVAETLADRAYVNCAVDSIEQRLAGRYDDGLGRSWQDPDYMKFFDDGRVNYPYLSDGMWFLTQHRRWGLLKTDPDYLAVARAVNRIDLYAEAAQALGIALPAEPMRSGTLFDGSVWDGSDPAGYAARFAIRA